MPHDGRKNRGSLVVPGTYYMLWLVLIVDELEVVGENICMHACVGYPHCCMFEAHEQ